MGNRATRRGLLAGLASLTFLVSCGTGTTTQQLSQAIDVAQNVINAGIAETPVFATTLPKVLPPDLAAKVTNPLGTGYLDQAKALLVNVQLSSMVDDKLPMLDKVLYYINLAMQTLAPVLTAASAGIPQLAATQTILQDCMLALPILELFIKSALPPSTSNGGVTTPTNASRGVASARAKAIPQGAMSPEAALADLKARMGR